VGSGATAIPLETELGLLSGWLGADFRRAGWLPPGAAFWLATVRRAVTSEAPLLRYGTDWLAFGHFAIALAFVGALKDPVRNRWLFSFAKIVCALVVPWALVLGEIRGIPLGWRLIDSSFGLLGLVPALAGERWAFEAREGRAGPRKGLPEAVPERRRPGVCP